MMSHWTVQPKYYLLLVSDDTIDMTFKKVMGLIPRSRVFLGGVSQCFAWLGLPPTVQKHAQRGCLSLPVGCVINQRLIQAVTEPSPPRQLGGSDCSNPLDPKCRRSLHRKKWTECIIGP